MYHFSKALTAAAVMLALSPAVMAEPIFMDVGAAGDGYTGTASDADTITGNFDQFGVFAQTTTVQFDTNGTPGLNTGDRFADSGVLNVGSLIAGSVVDNEGLEQILPWYELTAVWGSGKPGVPSPTLVTALDPTNTNNYLRGETTGTSVSGPNTVTTIQYDSTNNAVFEFFFDSSGPGASTPGTRRSYSGASVESPRTGVDSGDVNFADGVKVLEVEIIGGSGTNTFGPGLEFLSGSSVLSGRVIFAQNDFFHLADGTDFNDLVGSLLTLSVKIDQNTDNVFQLNPGDATPAGVPGVPAGALFNVLSDHDGSVEFETVLVPEPATLILLGGGLLGLAAHRSRRRYSR